MDAKQMNLTEISIKVIEENDLCISCGACTHICPFDNIIMSYISYRGKFDAVVQNEEICLKCNGAKNCLAVCPSYNVNYEKLAQSSQNNFLGKVEKVYNGYAKSDKNRFSSSSGGFIRTLSQELLDNKKIDGIISISHDKGLEYTPKILTDSSLMPNSIYHNINYENTIELLKNNNGKYLLIGLPCQITSVEQLINKKKFFYLKDRIYAKVALICGYTFERTNMNFFADSNKFDMETITYRENGRYRKTRISNENSSLLFNIYNPSTVRERIHNSIMFDKLIPQKHCLFCVDHIGYCADIVVGDAWQSRYKEDSIGTNIIITRTKLGEDIINSLENMVLEDGYIDEIEASQHFYAKPYLGLSFAEENIFNDKFVVRHTLSTKSISFKPIIFSKKDKIKIIFLKKLLRAKSYKLGKLLYVLLEFKQIIKLYIKKILGRKI
jgi:coenzyme F420-reducing hydrogenase beta subunit